MRFTQVLCKYPAKFFLKGIWRNRGFVVKTRTMVPQVLAEKGVDILDAEQHYFPEHKNPTWVPPVEKDPRYHQWSVEDHRFYHETPILEFNTKTRLIAGFHQAQNLTKSQAIEGLPDVVQKNIGQVQIPDSEERVHRVILQANKWDSTVEKIPKRFNTKFPQYQYKAEYGIHPHRRSEIQSANLLRLVRQLGGSYPDVGNSLRVIYKPFVQALYDFQGKRIRVGGLSGEYMTFTNKPVPRYAFQQQVDRTQEHTLPDMFPIAPTIDLKKQHRYSENNISGFKEGFSHAAPQTLYMANFRFRTPSERNARALMFTFAHALSYAKTIYGPEPKVLPKPVTVNCIHAHTFNGSMDFMSFQLNTTDFSTSEGVKNIVWYDNNNTLYVRNEPLQIMLRNTTYKNYDANVFDKFVALHLTGLNMESTWEDVVAPKQAGIIIW